jgi:VIT1/CCC1 family predicted Fe2+/Mn2+ transporter
MSMAGGEYVSVHSHADSEAAELERERHELQVDVAGEHKELAASMQGAGSIRQFPDR